MEYVFLFLLLVVLLLLFNILRVLIDQSDMMVNQFKTFKDYFQSYQDKLYIEEPEPTDNIQGSKVVQNYEKGVKKLEQKLKPKKRKK